MAYVLVTTGWTFRVEEAYSDIVAAMDGPDLIEVHVGEEALTLRCAAIVGASETTEGLEPWPPPPSLREEREAEPRA